MERLPKISKAEYAEKEAKQEHAWLADYHSERSRIYGHRADIAMRIAVGFAVLAVIANVLNLVMH